LTEFYQEANFAKNRKKKKEKGRKTLCINYGTIYPLRSLMLSFPRWGLIAWRIWYCMIPSVITIPYTIHQTPYEISELACRLTDEVLYCGDLKVIALRGIKYVPYYLG
jgi:hypothetical protein